MATTREAALAALLTALSSAATFGVVTRRLLAPEQMCSIGSPGLALVVHHEEYHRPNFAVPPKRTITASVLIYVNAGAANPNAVPDSLLNPIIDGIDTALKADNGASNLCTLGGLVSHCSYSGSITITEGTLGDEAVALVPISILVPATS